jgi:hypothetical protein
MFVELVGDANAVRCSAMSRSPPCQRVGKPWQRTDVLASPFSACSLAPRPSNSNPLAMRDLIIEAPLTTISQDVVDAPK